MNKYIAMLFFCCSVFSTSLQAAVLSFDGVVGGGTGQYARLLPEGTIMGGELILDQSIYTDDIFSWDDLNGGNLNFLLKLTPYIDALLIRGIYMMRVQTIL